MYESGFCITTKINYTSDTKPLCHCLYPKSSGQFSKKKRRKCTFFSALVKRKTEMLLTVTVIIARQHLNKIQKYLNTLKHISKQTDNGFSLLKIFKNFIHAITGLIIFLIQQVNLVFVWT